MPPNDRYTAPVSAPQGPADRTEDADAAFDRMRDRALDQIAKNEKKAEAAEAAEMDRMAKRMDAVCGMLAKLSGNFSPENRREAAKMADDLLKTYGGDETNPNSLLAPVEDLYVDEYPLPKDARYEKLGSMEKARMPWVDPDGMYLVESPSAGQYDADGFPIKPASPDQPKIIPSKPRYEKLSPGERRRWWWLRDDPDQLYLVE